MLDENAQSRVNQTHQLVIIIWVAVLFSVMTYFAIAFFLTSQRTKSARPFSDFDLYWSRNLFMVVSFFLVSMAYLLKQYLLERASSSQETSAGTLIFAFTTASIATFVLSEIPAIFGLVLVFMSERVKEINPFAGLSFFCLFIYFPRKTQLESLIMEYQILQRKKE